MTVQKRKLIEVALPLEAINRESAREKSIRHGHPSTLHLWWARRPLAACRAVLFAQLVDDPSSHPELFPTEADQAAERLRLFDIIERLVVWENTTDRALLHEAHEEILKSTGGRPPTILDPFAGGGSIPLEAQRLGLASEGSDLNPVAVLINKALIEIPPKWADHEPVHPGSAEQRMGWPGSTGLAEDVRRYGQWMRNEAESRLGERYPLAELPSGGHAKVIAWVWARNVICPNPACAIRMPLVRSWWLGKKKGKEAFVLPVVSHDTAGRAELRFTISNDLSKAPTSDSDGTISRSGARCAACGTSASLDYVRDQGARQLMSEQLMAVVAQGDRRRIYLAPTPHHEAAAKVVRPLDAPDTLLSTHPQYMGTPRYGLTHHADLFTARQLLLLTVLSDLVSDARKRVLAAALDSGLPAGESLERGGAGAVAYADSIALFLAFAVDRTADRNSSLCGFDSSPKVEGVRNVFARQAISMVWDFGEGNPFHSGGGNISDVVTYIANAIERLNGSVQSIATQADASSRSYADVLVSTDPPYYDNVPYADLADFFYVWLRRSLGPVFPDLLGTMLTPKHEELVADVQRKGGREPAKQFFESGFTRVFERIRQGTPSDYPITVFYAFKQVEDDSEGNASTGWQTLLEGMLSAGWEVTATWPMRTELGNRMRSRDSNALASSIVLALRPRDEKAEALNRRAFLSALKEELPSALRDLQQGSIAPVDLAQAAIGPGMAVFSRYSRVVEADGSDMSVRTALALINQVLDEVLAAQEGDFDSATRFCIKWFSQFGWNDGASGHADVLARAVNSSVSALERGGVFRASAGKARLLHPSAMPDAWNPAADKSISVWEVAVRVAHALQTEGSSKAGTWMSESAARVDLDAVKELSYLLYSICEKKGWTEAALLFNGLGTSWSDLLVAARSPRPHVPSQATLDLDSEDED